MHWIMGVLSMLVVAGIHGTEVTAEESNRSNMSLTVNLKDGCKLIGATSLESLPVRSEALGKLNVPLAQIATVKFGKNHESVTLTMRNGDRLQGSLGETKLEMVTVFGPVIVPLDKVTEVQIQLYGVGRGIEWETLPYPTAHDWPGPRGAHAVIEADRMLIQGRPVRSRETFRAPITISCEVTAEYLHVSSADFLVEFVPTGLAKDAVVDQIAGTHRLNFGVGTSERLVLSRHDGTRWREVWSQKLPAMKATDAHRLEITLSSDRLRVLVDGRDYECDLALSPPDDFQLQLWNWQPSSRWRVRNFNVR